MPAGSSRATWSPGRSSRSPPTRSARDRRLQQRLLPLDQRQGLQRDRGVAGVPARRRLREPVLHADPPDVHPAARRLPVEAHADERVAAQRRPGLGAQERQATSARRTQIPEASATTTSSAATRASATSCRATSPRAGQGSSATRATASAERATASTSTSRTPSARLGKDVDRGALRQPLRHVRAHHRRESVRRADADLPRAALHDGRAVGGLQPDEHHPGLFVGRRGELLRPRRQPARRQRADAGLADGYFVLPVHDRRLPRPHPTRTSRADHERPSRRPSRKSASARDKLLVHQRHASVDSFHRELGKIMWDTAAWPATKRGPRGGDREDPGAARGVLAADVRCSAAARRPQPDAREGRARRRLPGVRRGHVPRRARARGVLRRPLPRGVPDRGGRGAARRRRVHARRRLGAHGRPTGAGAAQGAARVRERPSSAQRSYK